MNVEVRTTSGNEFTAIVPRSQFDAVVESVREHPVTEFVSEDGLIVLRSECVESLRIRDE